MPAATSFAVTPSSHVYWTPARLHQGLRFQPGWLVVRPGWVAFLPTEHSSHLVAQMALVSAGLDLRARARETMDFVAWWQHGAEIFDREVWQFASANGWVLQQQHGRALQSSKGVFFHRAEQDFAHCDVGVPEHLIAQWSHEPYPINARGLAKAFAALTSVPAAIGTVGGIVAWRAGEPTSDIVMGAGFWWLLVLGSWIGYFVILRKARRARSE